MLPRDTHRLATAAAPVRIGIFILLLLVCWLPLAAAMLWLVCDRNLASILTMGLLFGEFLLLVWAWGHLVYRESNLFHRYGLRWTAVNGQDYLRGLGVGFWLLWALFGVEGWLGWLVWQPPTHGWVGLLLAGFMVGLGVGLAEELFFRGWLLDELQRDYPPQLVLWVTSLIYAGLHFLRPLPEIFRTWPQFLGLVILGVILVRAKAVTQGRLGLAIGIHGGLVWGYYLINVGQLVRYTQAAPAWVTGIDHNPLAGLMGLLFLGLLAELLRWGWLGRGQF
ncbi:abortive phage infection protein [Neosynechococcus sphagnicola sy1]|uniref:Abortive phage infection protein n=1 Tax=Neosynechococcus sphagnicola sy1 TaxID=1497020 RepID=A0A098TKE7_9CYAN|nr:CPBP family intramembrane glutamic endopeptidase [Neosynechococcus sphagnicola]KGF72751.1 abortive phage infection protein [Neosynechococcus sphagnicola sy1]